jgi:hypothetical protein
MAPPDNPVPRVPPPPQTLEDALTKTQHHHPNQPFQPLPKPTGAPPYRLHLEDILPTAKVDAIIAAGRLDFHCVGDTGGVKDPYPQEAVAAAMAHDLSGPSAQSFLYHLGDVVYMHGGGDFYYAQFYEPYAHYRAPIVAIPGNHDGNPNPLHPHPSLTAFVRNFCSPKAELLHEADDVQRDAMIQPNVYWTLLTPFVTFIGLYTNVPDAGELTDDQVSWLVEELQAAPPDKAVIVALHHPIFSGDTSHGSDAALGQVVHDAFEKGGRWPDAVFSGHVHNYQRFTHAGGGGRQTPYLIAGAGGYHNLHPLAEPVAGGHPSLPWQTPAPGVTLEAYEDKTYGYMRVTASAGKLSGEYVSVPKPGAPGAGPPTVVDRWSLDTTTHTVS